MVHISKKNGFECTSIRVHVYPNIGTGPRKLTFRATGYFAALFHSNKRTVLLGLQKLP